MVAGLLLMKRVSCMFCGVFTQSFLGRSLSAVMCQAPCSSHSDNDSQDHGVGGEVGGLLPAGPSAAFQYLGTPLCGMVAITVPKHR